MRGDEFCRRNRRRGRSREGVGGGRRGKGGDREMRRGKEERRKRRRQFPGVAVDDATAFLVLPIEEVPNLTIHSLLP